MASRRSLVRRAVALATAATAAVVLAACGSSSDSSSSSPAPARSGHDTGATHASGTASQGSHDPQDVSFAQGMIPHHRQAVAMADLAASRAKSPQVKDLAATIKQAQDPEINTMSGWLEAWGEKVPGDSKSSMPGMDGMDGMPGMDRSASPMPGMMSDQDMGKLKGLSGDAFDKAFLRMMISHHQGAIEMAETEQSRGAYGPAKAMAKSIVTSQSAEITEMNKMLGKQ
ncbi:DUF305 domain-containing protein [Streptomyces anandii]|uniref:DUF305 domain-containing protein n=1 Tax=Streptomyces anandii TaxID=285454 RepID=UPI0016791629|nr:DUF305 domain-containing protein [Streptomyces anandii]GGX76121.1 lipoprotein [Streptomyces anandii JCM 4720]